MVLPVIRKTAPCVILPGPPTLSETAGTRRACRIRSWIPGYRSSRPCLNAENGQRLNLGCEDRVQLQRGNLTYYVAPSGARVDMGMELGT